MRLRNVPGSRDRIAANSYGWNGMARLKYIDFEDILPYMFSCRKMPDSNYFAGKATAGGYILVN